MTEPYQSSEPHEWTLPNPLRAICPLFIRDDRRWPRSIGSGVLLSIANARFVITSAHVMDLIPSAGALEVLSSIGGQLAPLRGEGMITNVPSSGDLRGDPNHAGLEVDDPVLVFERGDPRDLAAVVRRADPGEDRQGGRFAGQARAAFRDPRRDGSWTPFHHRAAAKTPR